MDHYIHDVPGRLRIKNPMFKSKSRMAEEVKGLLQPMRGVLSSDINTLTGSILIIHSGNLTSVMEIAETNNLFRLNGANQTPTVAVGIKTTFNDFNAQVKRLTGYELDIPTLAFLILLAAGLYQIRKGNAASIPWYTAIWYGMNIFLKGASA